MVSIGMLFIFLCAKVLSGTFPVKWYEDKLGNSHLASEYKAVHISADDFVFKDCCSKSPIDRTVISQSGDLRLASDTSQPVL